MSEKSLRTPVMADVKVAFGELKVGAGVEIEMTDDGGFTLTRDGEALLSYKPAATDAGSKFYENVVYKVGDTLPDGWIVGPISPDTGNPIAFEPLAGALEGERTWHEGEAHAEELRVQGHESARQPSTRELKALYNEVVKAGLNRGVGLDTDSLYWSGQDYSASMQDTALLRSLREKGPPCWSNQANASGHVRVIRDEPRLKLR